MVAPNESDKAKSIDAISAVLFVCLLIVVVIAFNIYGGQTQDTSNLGAGMMTGQQGLKVGVEEATSHPQMVLPR